MLEGIKRFFRGPVSALPPEAQPAPIVVPEIPANPTADQTNRLLLEYSRLGVILAVDARDRAAAAEAAHVARHEAMMAAAQRRHEESNPPFSIGDFAAALACRATDDVTPGQLDALTAERWGWLQGFAGPAAPSPQIPLPLPEPPAPGPVSYPMPSTDELDPPWYLSEMAGEFAEYGQPQTLDYARFHWREYGKPKGRKGNANGVGWGPQKEFAPPGVSP